MVLCVFIDEGVIRRYSESEKTLAKFGEIFVAAVGSHERLNGGLL